MPFTGIGNGKYRSPSGRIFTAKQVKMYYATDGFKHKKQRKVDNKMRSFGDFDEKTGKIRINKKMAKNNPMHKRQIKGRKGKYPELADTIYHEELHKKNPKLTEKQVYKKTKQAMKKLTPKVKKRLYAKYK